VPADYISHPSVCGIADRATEWRPVLRDVLVFHQRTGYTVRALSVSDVASPCEALGSLCVSSKRPFLLNALQVESVSFGIIH